VIWQHPSVSCRTGAEWSAQTIRTPLRRSTYLRWVYLLVGGALLSAYLGVEVLFAQAVRQSVAPLPFPILVGLVLALPPVATAFIPAVRVVEVAAVNALLGTSLISPDRGGSQSWSTRWRTAGFFLLHLIVGGVAGALTVGLPPMAVTLFSASLAGGRRVDLIGLVSWTVDSGGAAVLTLLAGVLALVLLLYGVAGLGALLAGLAPVLLGPSPNERMAELQRQADQLAERNRLARELHDSVGHALSIVGIQAGAANRVLDHDPDFVRQALTAIEDAAHSAMADLDHVLGVLREDPTSTTSQPTLSSLDQLLESTRAAGVEVDADLVGDLDRIPRAVSREAYRIVQEGLTNALRHAGRVPVTLRLAVEGEELQVELTNPLGASPAGPAGEGRADGSNDRRGGRGLRGIRERVMLLRGDMTAATEGQHWRVSVCLPLRSRP
jgi:signal transduction histidine kinase